MALARWEGEQWSGNISGACPKAPAFVHCTAHREQRGMLLWHLARRWHHPPSTGSECCDTHVLTVHCCLLLHTCSSRDAGGWVGLWAPESFTSLSLLHPCSLAPQGTASAEPSFSPVPCSVPLSSVHRAVRQKEPLKRLQVLLCQERNAFYDCGTISDMTSQHQQGLTASCGVFWPWPAPWDQMVAQPPFLKPRTELLSISACFFLFYLCLGHIVCVVGVLCGELVEIRGQLLGVISLFPPWRF